MIEIRCGSFIAYQALCPGPGACICYRFHISTMKRARTAPLVIPRLVLENLSKMQSALNAFIDPNWLQNRTADDWGLAITLESAELIESYPWKWWKNTHAEPDIKNVRIELVDILHFSLSGTRQLLAGTKPVLQPIPEALLVQPEGQHHAGQKVSILRTPLMQTSNAVATFRAVIDLTRIHRFDVITETVIGAAEDLDFNLVGYYIAKHTLNHIRQLGGYKSGVYKKMNDGIEDNVLLHQCIEQVTTEDVIEEATYVSSWEKVMTSVYEGFRVPAGERKTVAQWMEAAR